MVEFLQRLSNLNSTRILEQDTGTQFSSSWISISVLDYSRDIENSWRMMFAIFLMKQILHISGERIAVSCPYTSPLNQRL